MSSAAGKACRASEANIQNGFWFPETKSYSFTMVNKYGIEKTEVPSL